MLQLVDEVERVGCLLEVRRGWILLWLPERDDGRVEPKVERLADKIDGSIERLAPLLSAERGASVEALLALWWEDPQLRREFPGGVTDLEEHAIHMVEVASLS